MLQQVSSRSVWAVGVLLAAAFAVVHATPRQKDGDPVAIGTWRSLQSNVLGETRQVLVHLPDDYDRTTLRYPVLYHLYGQQVTGYFADAVMAAERLGSTAEIPPLIVVGVANTDRYRDNLPLRADGTGPGGADNFLRFFADELLPFIERNYRTKPYRILAGPQAGGAFGLHALTTRPNLFNAYILRIENPFPGTGAFRQFFLDKAAEFSKSPPSLNRFLSLHVESSAPPETLAFARRLGAIIDGAHAEGLRFELRVEPSSGDFVPLVGLTPALRSLFAGYTMASSPRPTSIEAIEGHYRALSARLGVDLEPPELTLTFAVDELMESNRLDAALALIQYERRIHPASLNALWRLGETNRRLGRLTDARDAYMRFLAIAPADAAMVRQRLAEVEKAIEGGKQEPIRKKTARRPASPDGIRPRP
jgi:hypothetical protein